MQGYKLVLRLRNLRMERNGAEAIVFILKATAETSVRPRGVERPSQLPNTLINPLLLRQKFYGTVNHPTTALYQTNSLTSAELFYLTLDLISQLKLYLFGSGKFKIVQN